jgi:hypothetical protein
VAGYQPDALPVEWTFTRQKRVTSSRGLGHNGSSPRPLERNLGPVTGS